MMATAWMQGTSHEKGGAFHLVHGMLVTIYREVVVPRLAYKDQLVIKIMIFSVENHCNSFKP
jgi:hypothetical protein